MGANESRLTREAASKAGGPGVRIRLRVSLRDIDTAHGWPTFAGAREALRRLDETLSAPDGVEVILEVGRIRPGLQVPEPMWRSLLSRFAVVVESDSPSVATDWNSFIAAVLGGAR